VVFLPVWVKAVAWCEIFLMSVALITRANMLASACAPECRSGSVNCVRVGLLARSVGSGLRDLLHSSLKLGWSAQCHIPAAGFRFVVRSTIACL